MEKDPEEVIKEALDDHMGFMVMDKLNGTGYGKDYNKGSIVGKHPEDKMLRDGTYEGVKKGIERVAFEKRTGDLKHLVLDVIQVRQKELLDKEDMPMKNLLDFAVKTMPKEVHIEAKVDIGFMSLYDQIDVEGEEVE